MAVVMAESLTPLKKRILIAEDDPGQRSLLEACVGSEGHEVGVCEDGKSALERLRHESWDLVVSDVHMPGLSGLELLDAIVSEGLGIPAILVTGYADFRDAVSAMEKGAVNYLAKPIDLDELRALIGSGEAPKPLEAQLIEGAVVESPLMKAVMEEVQLVAPSMARVLITGPSGSGKEVVAEHLHHWSDRSDGPLVKINCAAIPENLLESELFGHEKGAFTGAVSQHKGCFERAHQGTLFLDEVGELALPLQAKLLRVLQDSTLTRLGGRETMEVDVRVVAATNRDLEQGMEEGDFREDLYYRLNVFEFELPPLCERSEDVLPLARRFAELFSKQAQRFSPGLERALLAYDWPGNVRELQNAMERAVLLSRGGVLMPEHLPRRALQAVEKPSPSELTQPEGDGKVPLASVEQDWILKTLEKCEGNRTEAAKVLGISRRTLLYRLKKMKAEGVDIP